MSKTIDLHSHIAWEIDDGMPSKQDTLTSLQQAKEDGIVAICSTPHIIPGQLNQSILHEIRSRQIELEKMSPLPIYFGGEVMMNSEFIYLLDQQLYPTINGSKYMLVEFNVLKDIHQISWRQEALYECSIRGFIPVIAHIERYFHEGLDWDIIEQWQDEGYILQINRTSLMGYSSKQSKENAWNLLENGIGHIVCTDTHRCEGFRVECLSDAYNDVCNRIGEENANLLFFKNPKSILKGEEVEDLEIIKKKKRHFSLFGR